MSSSFAAIAQIFALNTGLYEQALEGLDHEAVLRRPLPQSNPLIWIAGHLATSRFSIASLVGQERALPWPKVFHRGNTFEDPATLPGIEIVRQGWREISAVLVPRLAEVSDDDLAAPSPRTFPIDDKSLRGAITFLAYHEGYHLGQISYIRKSLGHPGLIG